MSKRTALSRDAMTAVGLAGTALAFASSEDDEAERWLCTLRLYGEAGVLLQALGVEDGNRLEDGAAPSDDRRGPSSEARLAAVLTAAEEFAGQRSVSAVGTVDLLLAAMRVYGEAFDRALDRRGTSRVELVDRLARPSLRRTEQSGDAHLRGPRPLGAS